jgi:G:T-mismatch repair DNA endonuclease (very short patch repair protein)
VDPVFVTQTIIAVTILHEIHYSIEVPKTKTDYWFSKYNRVLHHYSVSIAATAVVVAVVVMVAAAC